MENSDKFLSILTKRLESSQRQLMSLINIETRKESLVFRAPQGFIALDKVWELAQQVAKKMKVHLTRADMFATLDELDDILGEIQWLWEGWIPRGFVTMIAGDPGIGKSAIAQHLCKIITEGTPFPLSEEPQRDLQNVIWVDTEAAQQILKVRGGTMKMDKKRVFLPLIGGDLLSQANLGSPEHRAHIINLIEGVEPAMLVLDSLGGAHSRGENKMEDIRPMMEFLATIARNYQIAVMVVHHLNKDRKDESPEVSLYRIRGSTGITGYCRSIFAIERTGEKNIKLRVIKSNLAVIGDPLIAVPLMDDDKNFTGFNYEHFVPPLPKRNKKEVCAEWVYATVSSQQKKGMPLAELVKLGESKGYSRQNVYATRELLDNRIAFSGTGNAAYWEVTREDKKAMKNMISNSNGKHKE